MKDLNFNVQRQHTWLVNGKTGTGGTCSLRMSPIKRDYVCLADHREATIYSRVGPSWSHRCIGELQRFPRRHISFPQIKNHLTWIYYDRPDTAPQLMMWNRIQLQWWWSNKCNCCRLTSSSSSRTITNTNDASSYCLKLTYSTLHHHRFLKIISDMKIISDENASVTLKSMIFFQTQHFQTSVWFI